MKIQFHSLLRGLLLMAAAVTLSNCASQGGGGFSSPAPVAPASGGASGGTRQGYADNSVDWTSIPPASPASQGLRFGSNALSHNAIDSLIAGGTATPGSSPKPPVSKNRPGLATQAGGERWDQLTVTQFYRKTTGSPDAVDSFNYNDEAGAQAMAGALGSSRLKSGTFETAGGRLDVALRRGYGGAPFRYYEAGDRRIVVGSDAAIYEIYVKNLTSHAMEIVASVDGLDVMDGKAAAIRKHGYILPAKGEMTIDGFRVDRNTVKQFRFGSVDSSAAAKAGMARNVGVIGLAVYEEDEAQAKLARLVESQQRGAASAFPVGAR